MTLLYSYITDNLYICKLQPNKPIECPESITACSRAGRWGGYWCDITLHCTGLAATAATWDDFVPLFYQTFKCFKKHHLQFWMPLTSGPWSMWGCHGLCLSLIYPNMTCWSFAQVSRIKQVLEAEKIKPQETLTEDFMVEKGDTFLWPFWGVGNLDIQHKHIRIIYASMICLNTHIVILCNIMS